ncbi:hypothetical protein NDU88_001906 [Pleurodeles waltl]|uniref:Uncharacterized protein n=1 Tax=Pleurodeles waltl TaxID=8319 RepID=A0AAV7KT55_PLEWA|nr:hypothetical protein NDU88_001906 [Pleurodeles waltl]
MLAWLLRCERPLPVILSLCGPVGDMIMGQERVSYLLLDHLRGVYASPLHVDDTLVDGFLAGLQLPGLMEAQESDLEGNIQLEELQEALLAMPSGKAQGPDGLPAEFFQTYSATLVPSLLKKLCERHGGSTDCTYERGIDSYGTKTGEGSN